MVRISLGVLQEADEKVTESLPRALKREVIFNDLTARLEVVPFPEPSEPECFRNLLVFPHCLNELLLPALSKTSPKAHRRGYVVPCQSRLS